MCALVFSTPTPRGKRQISLTLGHKENWIDKYCYCCTQKEEKKEREKGVEEILEFFF